MNSEMIRKSNKKFTIIRDLGPYSSRYSSKGSLLTEAGNVIHSLSKGFSIEEVRKQAVDGTILQQRTLASRQRVWRLLHYRLLAHRTPWVENALKHAREKGLHSPEFVSLIYFHYALRDHLTYDVVTNLIWNKWQKGQTEINREDVLSLLDDEFCVQPQINRWAESTRVKLAASILTGLRDFGVLEGSQKKRIVRPTLPLSTAEHLLRILISEDIQGREVLEHSTWRLFLCTQEDVANVLVRLDQAKLIQFERTGDIIVLHTPEDWKEAI